MSRPKVKSKSEFDPKWLSKSIESLENKTWSNPEDDSYLVQTCHELRKKKLDEFEIEDLRIMISQDIGLDYLIPMAILKLKENILAEGDYYEGDLLKAVITSDLEYWKKEKANWSSTCKLIQSKKTVIKDSDISGETKSQLFEAYREFELIK